MRATVVASGTGRRGGTCPTSPADSSSPQQPLELPHVADDLLCHPHRARVRGAPPRSGRSSRSGWPRPARLTHALQTGVIAGAALDVLEDEPPDPDDPIVALPNIITFPHIGTATEETRKAMRGLAVENLIAVLSGEEPPACVNPSVLTR